MIFLTSLRGAHATRPERYVRNNLACLLHDDRVADADVLAGDFVGGCAGWLG